MWEGKVERVWETDSAIKRKSRCLVQKDDTEGHRVHKHSTERVERRKEMTGESSKIMEHAAWQLSVTRRPELRLVHPSPQKTLSSPSNPRLGRLEVFRTLARSLAARPTSCTASVQLHTSRQAELVRQEIQTLAPLMLRLGTCASVRLRRRSPGTSNCSVDEPETPTLKSKSAKKRSIYLPWFVKTSRRLAAPPYGCE